MPPWTGCCRSSARSPSATITSIGHPSRDRKSTPSELQSRQDLRSFPTRRSSDLPLPATAGGPRAARHHHDGVAHRAGSRRPLAGGVEGPTADDRRCRHGRAAAGVRRAHHPRLLRVSVIHPEIGRAHRLNSSHAKIYALSLHDALPISRFPQLQEVHARPDTTMTELRIALDLDAPWLEAWKGQRLTTGDAAMDGLLQEFGALTIRDYYEYRSSIQRSEEHTV